MSKKTNICRFFEKRIPKLLLCLQHELTICITQIERHVRKNPRSILHNRFY